MEMAFSALAEGSVRKKSRSPLPRWLKEWMEFQDCVSSGEVSEKRRLPKEFLDLLQRDLKTARRKLEAGS
jgi:hypothetical protein